MKKWYRLDVLTIIIFILCITLPSSIGKVQASNINYTISYSTHIICTAQIQCEGDLNPIPLKNYNQSFNLDVTDPTIVTAIKNYKQESLKQINETTPNAIVSDRTFVDGYEYPIPPENAKYYFRFFELPTNFNGTKTIVKDDIPFKVTGNGKGNLSMTIVSDFIGTKEKKFIIPEEKIHTITEGMVSQNYNVSYWIPNSATEFVPNGYSSSYNAKTLKEALEHCAQNADLNKTIRISVTQTYRVDINATASHKMYLNTTYGNSIKNSSDSLSSNTKQESSTTQGTSSTDKVLENNVTGDSSQNNVIVGSSQNNTTDDSSQNNATLVENVEIANSISKEKDDDNTKQRTPLKNIILLCTIPVLALGILSILLIKKPKTIT